MSQRWIHGPVCGVDNCRSRLYRSSDGHKVCQYGHVMEGNIEINDDQDENYVTTRRLNITLTGVGGEFALLSQAAALQSRGITKSKESKKLYGVAAKKLYLRCLQLSLQHKIRAVVAELCPGRHRKEFEHSLVAIVRVYWLRVLDEYILAIEDPHRRAPSAVDALALIYLAVLRLNFVPVYLVDLVPRINDNVIPFMKCLHLLPKELLEALPSYFHKSIQPPYPITVNELARAVRTLAPTVGQAHMAVPPTFYYPMALLVLRESLLLPNAPALFCICCDLLKRMELNIGHQPKSPELAFPETVVLSVVVSVVLNEIAALPFSVDRWLAALDEHEQNSEFSFAHKDIGDVDLLNWSNFKVEKYCQWLYNNIVPAKNKVGSDGNYSDELSIADKRLFQIFEDTEPTPSQGTKLDTQQDEDPVMHTTRELVYGVAGSTPKNNSSVAKSVALRLLYKFATILGTEVAAMTDVYNFTNDHLRGLSSQLA